MKVLRIVFALAMGALGGMLLAQTESDFSGWMKQVAKSNGALKGAVASKDAKVVATEAKTLEGLFQNVEKYFTGKNMKDGADMAKAAAGNAAKAAKAADGGTIDEASITAVGGACQGCHAAHREKGADNAYHIK
jgi:hypothetical protein